jgi:hypothetical protein
MKANGWGRGTPADPAALNLNVQQAEGRSCPHLLSQEGCANGRATSGAY